MKKPVENVNEWDSAIKDALQRMKRLRKSLKLWRQMRDAGEEWPGFVVSETEMGEEKAPDVIQGL